MNRNISIDILKLILAIFVVLLHCAFLKDFSKEISFILVEGLFRIAVPIFLIVTGYYFYSIKNLIEFKRWFKRIIILFLLWNLFYLPFWYKLQPFLFYAINGFYVLWYLSNTALAGFLLYLCRDFSTNFIFKLSLILYFFGWILQEIGNLHITSSYMDSILNITAVHRNFLFVCFPFLAIGYLINKTSFSLKIKFPLLLASILLIIFEAYINFSFVSKYDALDQPITAIIVAPIVFLYFLNLKILGKSKQIANFSTAIYLIHPLFIGLIGYKFIDQQTLLSFIVLISSIISSVFIVLINRKMKFIL